MNRSVLILSGLVFCLFAAESLAQGRGVAQGGCRDGNTSQTGQSPCCNQSSFNSSQFANPYQQSVSQQAAYQQALQNVFQQQAGYRQQLALKRQVRRDRQLAAIAKRKAEEAAKFVPDSIVVPARDQVALKANGG